MVNTDLKQLRTLPKAQEGAVLAVSLIMLMTLTIIGVAALSNTRMQETMAGNLQEQVRAFQASDGGAQRAWYEFLVYDTSVNNFTCEDETIENSVDYSFYSQEAAMNMVDGDAAYKYIGAGTAGVQSNSGTGDKINDGTSPEYFFVWRSRAKAVSSKAASSVYLGVKKTGAATGGMYETGPEAQTANPC